MGVLSGLFGKKGDASPPDFPFPLKESTGKQAASTLRALFAETKDTGQTPVLVGDTKDLEKILQVRGYNQELPEPEEIIRQALAKDPAAWLKERYADEEFEGMDQTELLGTWPTPPRPETIMRTPRKLLMPGFKKTVYIALLPTKEAWQAPAYLRVGGWNEYPDPAMECAVARMWEEKYGAKYAACLGDTVEFLVDAPPDDRNAAEELAWEHYNYCPDIVDQGAETICNLASVLLNGTVWFFWWD